MEGQRWMNGYLISSHQIVVRCDDFISQQNQCMGFTFHIARACPQYSDILYRAQPLTKNLLKQGYITPRLKSLLQTGILRSSSWTGWSLQNIHFLNYNWSFAFYINIFFPLSQTKLLPDMTICVSWRLSYKKQELLTLREHLG